MLPPDDFTTFERFLETKKNNNNNNVVMYKSRRLVIVRMSGRWLPGNNNVQWHSSNGDEHRDVVV